MTRRSGKHDWTNDLHLRDLSGEARTNVQAGCLCGFTGPRRPNERLAKLDGWAHTIWMRLVSPVWGRS